MYFRTFGNEPTGEPEPPCHGIYDNNAFLYTRKGQTYTGYTAGYPYGPKEYDLDVCYPSANNPSICRCVCDADYPI